MVLTIVSHVDAASRAGWHMLSAAQAASIDGRFASHVLCRPFDSANMEFSLSPHVDAAQLRQPAADTALL